ncbi:DUF262 domain-containing protein [Thermus sp.]|uniref:DUF262 domain-containing protein n=1 Tax=Thermus sp. TaxID=275 RepID=UPI0028CE6BAE|nr:DUF262 domain-containing protein [Thermus sp.]MDT7909435.1 DUF262 domain-containing protein [Thermus sp.]
MLRAAHSANSLFDLVDKSQRHEYQVPEFQRDLVWGPEQVRELLVSLVQGHYAGALLVLEFNPTTPPFAHREIYGTGPLPSPATSTRAYSVLDGQQRISAVYYAFQHPNLPLPPSSKKRPYRFFLKLDKLLSSEFDEAVLAEPEGSPGFRSAVAGWIAGTTIPFGPINPSLLPSHPSGLITLWHLLTAGPTAAGSLLLSFLSGVRSPLAAASPHVLSALLPLLTYEFDVIVLSPSFPTPPTRLVSFIAPLFVNVNSKGTRLTLFDLAVAHLFPVLHPRINLRSLWEELPTTHPGLGTLIAGRRRWIDPDDLLRIMALITGGSVKRADLLDHLHGVATDLTSGRTRSSPVGYTFTSFSDLWNEAASCLEKACNRVIKDYGALSPEWIPYTSMLIPLAALIHVEKRSGAPGARNKVDCWYWHSVLYERYEKSVDTTAMADFNQVTNWILGTSGKPSWISGAVPPGLDLKVEDEPQSAIFKAVLNLFALAGARNLLNGDPPGTDLELDHLFPKGGAKPWSGHSWINSVLNFTLLEPSVNKNKKNKDPDIFYHSDMLPGHAASGRPVRDTCQSHLIGPGAEKVFSGASSASPSAVKDFEQFIEEREKDVLDAIKKLLSRC